LIKVKEDGYVEITNGTTAADRSLVLFNNGGDTINIRVSSDAIILYCDEHTNGNHGSNAG
jgi:hypothetical protein